MKSHAHSVALGGILAALALAVLWLGGLIPVATYVCPMLAAVLLHVVYRLCGERIAWAWYAAVSLLAVLVGPDKEAAGVFLALGYYPIVKPKLDKSRFSLLLKLLLFNGAACLLYAALIFLFGMDQIRTELQSLGVALLIVTLLLGNLTFFLLDRLLGRFSQRSASAKRGGNGH